MNPIKVFSAQLRECSGLFILRCVDVEFHMDTLQITNECVEVKGLSTRSDVTHRDAVPQT
jgi:hypothetical protein